MKIYYWSPFFSNIATINSVLRSAESIINYSEKKKKIKISLIDAIGEWDKYTEKINNKIEIIKLNKISLIKYLPKKGYLRSRFSFLFIFFFNFFKLKNLIQKQKPNFIFVHLMTSLPIFLTLFIKKETKIILRISGLPKLNLVRYCFWKIFSKKIYKVTCPTFSTYQYLLKKNIFDEDKLSILRDPVIKIDDFINKKKSKFDNDNLREKKFIIGIGRFTRQKNFILLVKAFSDIVKKYPEYNLVLLGEGEQKKNLVKNINNLKISDKVHLLGFQENVYKFLKKADCFILSSLWEDPGFVLLEAAVSNTTIISSDCPNGPAEILGNEGFLFKNNSLQDLIEKFNEYKNTKKEIIYKNKILIKKRIKMFTHFQHFQSLKKLII